MSFTDVAQTHGLVSQLSTHSESSFYLVHIPLGLREGQDSERNPEQWHALLQRNIANLEL